MPRYDRGYDAGYGRDRARRYDFGLRGGGAGGPRRHPLHIDDPRDRGPGPERRMHARTPRVTARYNLDYTIPGPLKDRTVSYERFEGPDAFPEPYRTIGGTRTFRGGGRPLDWEREWSRYGMEYYGP